MPVKPKTIVVSFSLIYYSYYNLYLIISLEMWVQDDGSWMCSRNVNTVCPDSRLQSEAGATSSHPQPKKSESQCSSMVCSPFPKQLFEVTKWIWLTCAADIQWMYRIAFDNAWSQLIFYHRSTNKAPLSPTLLFLTPLKAIRHTATYQLKSFLPFQNLCARIFFFKPWLHLN